MKKTLLLSIVIALFFSCKQGTSQTLATPGQETANAVRTYHYTNNTSGRLIIQNSLPRGGAYTGSDGTRHPYVVFYTSVTNESNDPVQFNIQFPSDSFELTPASGNYLELIIPPDAMAPEKVSRYDYGLPVKEYLEKDSFRPHSSLITVLPKQSKAFYVVLRSPQSIKGTMRTGLYLKGDNLIYRISAYESVPELPLIAQKEINCGTMNAKEFMLEK